MRVTFSFAVRSRGFAVRSNTAGQSNVPVSSTLTESAVEVGKSFFANVTRSMPRRGPPASSAAGRHNRLQHARPGARAANKMAVVAMEAARQLRRSKLAWLGFFLTAPDISIRNSYSKSCTAPWFSKTNISYLLIVCDTCKVQTFRCLVPGFYDPRLVK